MPNSGRSESSYHEAREDAASEDAMVKKGKVQGAIRFGPGRALQVGEFTVAKWNELLTMPGAEMYARQGDKLVPANDRAKEVQIETQKEEKRAGSTRPTDYR